jgi:hypothetical protein
MAASQRASRVLRRNWDTIGLAAAVAGLLAASLPLSPIAASIPRGVLSITLALIVIQLLREIREPLTDAPATRPAASPPIRGVAPVVAVLWMSGLLLAVLLLGTVAGILLFSFAYLRWHVGESRVASLTFALVLGAGVQLVFGTLLHAVLYPGWLWTVVR